MNSFFKGLKYKLQNLMQGRYGFDELSRTLVFASLVFFVLSALFRLHILYIVACVILLWAYFRCFSKNFTARQKEFSAYFRIKNKLMKKIRLYKNIWRDRKSFKYFKCDKCGAYLKVPKGKGKIRVTCRNCKNEMTKKT